MKILYLDLSNTPEDYSIFPKRYGGARIFAAYAKQEIPNFKILSIYKAFENFNSLDNSKSAIVLTSENQKKLWGGEKLVSIFPEANNFDIVVHHHNNTAFNTERLNIPLCAWQIGKFEKINPGIRYLLQFDEKQIIFGEATPKIYPVVLGVEIPKCEIPEKQNFIFQCGLISDHLNCAALAEICVSNKIRIIFAGPIDHGYHQKFLSKVDGYHATYIGEIQEERKIELLKLAIATTQLHRADTLITLAAKQALAYGCAVIATNPTWANFIIDGYNGYMTNTTGDFFDAWSKIQQKNILPENCIESVRKKYNMTDMISSFLYAFEKIVADHRNQ